MSTPESDPFTPPAGSHLAQLYALPARLAAIEEKIAQLAIPAPAPVDAALVKEAMLAPDLLDAFAKAVGDENARRLAE